MNPYKKKYWLLSFVVLMLLYSKTRAQGIDFMPEGTAWEKALQLAKDSNKLVFVDVFTDWCGPCKAMDKDVFPQQKVGAKFNAAFINYKLDAEKGRGPELKKQYRVISYPTYLFVRADGTLIYRTNSSMTVAALLKEADNALKESKNPVTLVQLDSIYYSGNRDKQFMYSYLKKRLQLKQDNVELLEEYVNMLSPQEQSDTLNLKLIADNGNFLVRNLKLGKPLELLMKQGSKIGLTPEELLGLESTAIDKSFTIAVQQKNNTLLQQVLKANKRKDGNFGDNNKALQANYDYLTEQYTAFMQSSAIYGSWLMHFAESKLDSMDKVIYEKMIPDIKASDMSAADKEFYIQSYKRTQSIQVIRNLEGLCSKMVNAKPGKQGLANAAAWGKRMIYLLEKDTAYYQYVYAPCLKTYAEVLYINNHTAEAIKYLERAVALMQDKKTQVAYSELLDKWKQNKSNKVVVK
ncbi:MAG: thioredoxin family protein [Chitinophagaceae bacterium]